ncbi:hypothetical protein B7P02_15585 [Bordetella bronchiseptica]|nr:hypothetical protein B7P02_15585 [Bordetella bronchiseptica]
MRVSLLEWGAPAHVRLRFGRPCRVIALGGGRGQAVFEAGQRCARWLRVRNGYGIVREELLILQASCAGQVVQRVAGVSPGARVLLRAQGPTQVTAVLMLIERIEAAGFVAHDVAPCYWRSVHNRLMARYPLPMYTAARHAAWSARRTLQE